MCGIIITPDTKKLDSIKHRGIQFTTKKGKNGLIYGHHRLPIQTLEDDNWTQPIKLDYGYLLFNGEIFNYDKEKFNSDSEYLQHFFNSITSDGPDDKSYEKEVNTWDGFWSIVIVLEDRDELFVFTDPLGKKQLYYNTDTLEISSEVKGLSNSNEIDNTFVSIVNKWGYNTDNRTMFKDVKRVMPNKFHKFLLNEMEVIVNTEDYFKWDQNVPDKSIYELLDESVQMRLLSKKYKVSTLFSGGLDSTIILYFLRKHGADVDLYSIDNTTDGEHIKRMQKEWDLDIRFLDVDPNNISDEQRMKIYDINDSMIDLGSVIPQYYLFKEIPNKIVLTGDGADELFGGYRRINEYDSQGSDTFEELPFYHLVRIDRMSMHFTIECRNPFLGHDVIRKALSLPYDERTNKKILKDAFRGKIPDFIIDREKNPLKIDKIRKDPTKYRRELIESYINHVKTKPR